MALPSTYSELQSVALDVLGRDGDTTLTAYAPIAIGLVEAKINRHLRTAPMEASVPLSGADGMFPLPADFGGALLVEVPSFGPLEQVGDEWGAAAFPTGEGCIPRHFSVQGGSLKTFPAYSGTLTLRYYKFVPPLSDTEPTNWLLGSHPDVYLFLTLSELNAYAKDGEAALIWNQRGMTAAEEIKAQDAAKRFTNPAIRVRGPTP